MSFVCSIYGLGVQLNQPIAGLTGLLAPEQIDVQILLGSEPSSLASIPDNSWKEYYLSPELEEDGKPGVRVRRLSNNEYFRIDYHDGTVIVVNAQGSLVWATWPDTATVEDTATYLLGPTLGFLLRLRGITCLHASAVVIDGRVVALVGPAGSGKSTMAAAFARLGHAVLTDDVLALVDQGGKLMAQPAYPRVRLWPDSVMGLFGSRDALPRITPGWDKRFLDLNHRQFHFQKESLPLAAIYFLEERRDQFAEPRIQVIGAHSGLMSLVANTFANYLLDKPMRGREFEFLARLVESMPMRRVVPTATFGGLQELCQAISADCRQIEVGAHKFAVS